MQDCPILTKAQFAETQGIGYDAVRKWITRGHLTGDALTADGRINVAAAELQLRARLSTYAGGTSRRRAAASPNRRDEREPGPPVTTAPVIASSAASLSPGQPDLPYEDLTLRENILAVELERKQRQLEAEKGVYVRADQVRAERGKALAQMIAAIDNWVPEMVAELGLDREQLARVKASWRRFRERQADAMLAEALALPETLSDAA